MGDTSILTIYFYISDGKTLKLIFVWEYILSFMVIPNYVPNKNVRF